jgi:uncharacterized damage-inducible protein DinB
LDFLAKARRQMLAGQVNDARERLLASFAGLTDEEMLQPGVDGERSVRDILANIAAWDRAYTATFRAMLAGERHPMLDMDEEGVEEFNRRQQDADKDKTVDEVISDLSAAREELVGLLREVDNMQLFAPAPGDEHADMSIAACLSVIISEDEAHADMIEEWREGTRTED